MTLTQLRYLVALDKYKNFVRAAESCLVAQPTLSLQIQKLEHEIGSEIFDRTKNPIATTSYGLEIIEQAKLVLKEADHLEEMFREGKGEVSGEISIGIIPTISAYLLPQIFQLLNLSYPFVSFRFFYVVRLSLIGHPCLDTNLR